MIADNGVLALSISPTSAIAAIGSDVDFVCNFDSPTASIAWNYRSNNSNPYPTIIWKGGEIDYSFNQHYTSRYRVETNTKTRQSSLTILSVQLNDSGFYACKEHGMSNVSRATLNVTGIQISYISYATLC